jgi:hypothetical protein
MPSTCIVGGGGSAQGEQGATTPRAHVSASGRASFASTVLGGESRRGSDAQSEVQSVERGVRDTGVSGEGRRKRGQGGGGRQSGQGTPGLPGMSSETWRTQTQPPSRAHSLPQSPIASPRLAPSVFGSPGLSPFPSGLNSPAQQPFGGLPLPLGSAGYGEMGQFGLGPSASAPGGEWQQAAQMQLFPSSLHLPSSPLQPPSHIASAPLSQAQSRTPFGGGRGGGGDGGPGRISASQSGGSEVQSGGGSGGLLGSRRMSDLDSLIAEIGALGNETEGVTAEMGVLGEF